MWWFPNKILPVIRVNICPSVEPISQIRNRNGTLARFETRSGTYTDSETKSRQSMPGESCNVFIEVVENALSRKYDDNIQLSSWIAPASLYKLWKYSSGATTELFSDCFIESGALKNYCSRDSEDIVLGALGSWKDNEDEVDGGAANLPFHLSTIYSLINTSDAGTRSQRPYCHCAVLPLGNSYNVIRRMKEIISEGTLLVFATPGCFPFRTEQSLLSTGHLKPKANIYQSIGLFIWCNREYDMKSPGPLDVQEMYEAWVENCLYNPEKVVLHAEAFEKAFLAELRRRGSSLGALLTALEWHTWVYLNLLCYRYNNV